MIAFWLLMIVGVLCITLLILEIINELNNNIKFINMQFLKNLQSKILTTPETSALAPETALATSEATAEKNIYPVVFKTIEESQNETVKSVLSIF